MLLAMWTDIAPWTLHTNLEFAHYWNWTFPLHTQSHLCTNSPGNMPENVKSSVFYEGLKVEIIWMDILGCIKILKYYSVVLINLTIIVWIKNVCRDFPGSPVVKNMHFHCGGHRFGPGQGTKICILCDAAKE